MIENEVIREASLDIGGGGFYNEIVLFGTGESAEQFYAKYKNEVEIKFCLDNSKEKQNKRFHGLSIYSPYGIDISKYKIVISSMYYYIIEKQLRNIGLKEFRNFIPDSMFRCKGKKLALIHGNCHTAIIQQYLTNCQEFSNDWVFYPVPRICEFKELGIIYIDEVILRNCNLFIYQYISSQYGELSTDYLLSELNKNCIKINLANTYGHAEGFFPQIIIPNEFNSEYKANKYGLFPFGDKNIISLMEQNYSVEDIVCKLKYEEIYTKSDVYKDFRFQLEQQIKKEKDCDIKVSNYIKKFYKKERLFYDPYHPTNFLLEYISNVLLECLGIRSGDFKTKSLYTNLGQWKVPIYPCVSKHLGLEFEANTGRVPCDEFENQELSFDRYMRAYIKYCYGIE